jgi:hypothetical protein
MLDIVWVIQAITPIPPHCDTLSADWTLNFTWAIVVMQV